ncbi:MAG: hypothetical protein J6T24_05670, partial [Clostridia bacterium]|nr:hypothetical protein [Clostridia bacterium]
LPKSLCRMHGTMVLGSKALQTIRLPTLDFWTGRIQGEWSCTAFQLGGHVDALRILSPHSTRLATIIRGHLSSNQYHLIPED